MHLLINLCVLYIASFCVMMYLTSIIILYAYAFLKLTVYVCMFACLISILNAAKSHFLTMSLLLSKGSNSESVNQ